MAIFVQINAMARQNDMGREGESEARAYLVKHGYNVLHTNWHWHHYELDIIAVKEDELIVVEVDLERSENVRRWWPFLRDRRIDAYEGLTKRFLD